MPPILKSQHPGKEQSSIIRHLEQNSYSIAETKKSEDFSQTQNLLESKCSSKHMPGTCESRIASMNKLIELSMSESMDGLKDSGNKKEINKPVNSPP